MPPLLRKDAARRVGLLSAHQRLLDELPRRKLDVDNVPERLAKLAAAERRGLLEALVFR